jgi:hypothetical protein
MPRAVQQESGSVVKSLFGVDFGPAHLITLHELPTPSRAVRSALADDYSCTTGVWTARAGCWLGALAADRGLPIRGVERTLVVRDRRDQQQELACRCTARYFRRLARRTQAVIEPFDDWIKPCGVESGTLQGGSQARVAIVP